MKKAIFFLLFGFFASVVCTANGEEKNTAARQYFELRIYHFSTGEQMAVADSFFKTALVPALHKAGVKRVGVFAAAGSDTAVDKKMYLLISYKSLRQMEGVSVGLQQSKTYNKAGAFFLQAAHDKPPYTRYETVLLQAFTDMPEIAVPQLTGTKKDRVYELRSYEGPTDAAYQNKVKMFNAGGEVKLFDRLGFNAVFYGEVISGNRMPNLMYMTSFNNKASRDQHWKTFGTDPEWKALSARPEYQHNVTKIDISFLTPAEYSDL